MAIFSQKFLPNADSFLLNVRISWKSLHVSTKFFSILFLKTHMMQFWQSNRKNLPETLEEFNQCFKFMKKLTIFLKNFSLNNFYWTSIMQFKIFRRTLGIQISQNRRKSFNRNFSAQRTIWWKEKNFLGEKLLKMLLRTRKMKFRPNLVKELCQKAQHFSHKV